MSNLLKNYVYGKLVFDATKDTFDVLGNNLNSISWDAL